MFLCLNNTNILYIHFLQASSLQDQKVWVQALKKGKAEYWKKKMKEMKETKEKHNEIMPQNGKERMGVSQKSIKEGWMYKQVIIE